jgi:hypothetical protein
MGLGHLRMVLGNGQVAERKELEVEINRYDFVRTIIYLISNIS